jgi:hypothetical protein
MSVATLTLTTFTPGEAEKITSVSTAQQRDWRRRGFVRSNEGHARFDAYELAELWTLKLLSDRGIGPQLAKGVADWVAAGIVWHALKWVDAYEGDHQRALEWNKSFIERYDSFDWGDKALWLRGTIHRDRGFGGAVPAPYFIWLADGSHVFHMSVDAVFGDGTSSDPRFAGPVIVLDLSALGSTLLGRAKRPFVHVEIPTHEDAGSPDDGGQTNAAPGGAASP